MVLNGGVQFSLRNQDALFSPTSERPRTTTRAGRVEATTYTTDLWAHVPLPRAAPRGRGRVGQRRHGQRSRAGDSTGTGDSYDIEQFGYALEAELRLARRQARAVLRPRLRHRRHRRRRPVLGRELHRPSSATSNNDTISTFRFHPSYRVDLILWRNIMRQVTGAYYFRPGISYDFVRSDFGQLLGARLDFIWSRASRPLQTWGNDPDLGVEIDVSCTSAARTGRTWTTATTRCCSTACCSRCAAWATCTRTPTSTPPRRCACCSACVLDGAAREQRARNRAARADERPWRKSEKTVYECSACGAQSPKWLGRCPDCGAWSTLVETRAQRHRRQARAGARRRAGQPQPLDAGADRDRPSACRPGIGELDRVLGGGLVPGAVMLIGGDPGIGKCTLLMQACLSAARRGASRCST